MKTAAHANNLPRPAQGLPAPVRVAVMKAGPLQEPADLIDLNPIERLRDIEDRSHPGGGIA